MDMRNKAKMVAISCILCGVIAAFFAFTALVINPVIAKFSISHVEAMTLKATNNAIAEVITKNTFREIVNIARDSSGRITALNTDYIEMNRLASDIAFATQSALEQSRNIVPIPLGTLSGIPLFSGMGAPVNLRVVPIGAVNCRFNATFIEAGINQTRHRIVLLVQSKVNVIMPLGSQTVEVEVGVMFSESIIVGEVPSFVFRR